MVQAKVGASQHNVRATPGNNPSSGSNRPEPPSLTGGGGSTDLSNLNSSKLVGTPPPIKRRASDPCYSGRPCGDLWGTHSNLPDLRRHLFYLFEINWPVISKMIGIYGVDGINQNLHTTQRFVSDQLAQGKEIDSLAKCFVYCMGGIKDAEPELSPEAAAERDVTVSRGIDSLRPKKKDERQKWLDDMDRKKAQG